MQKSYFYDRYFPALFVGSFFTVVISPVLYIGTMTAYSLDSRSYDFFAELAGQSADGVLVHNDAVLLAKTLRSAPKEDLEADLQVLNTFAIAKSMDIKIGNEKSRLVGVLRDLPLDVLRSRIARINVYEKDHVISVWSSLTNDPSTRDLIRSVLRGETIIPADRTLVPEWKWLGVIDWRTGFLNFWFVCILVAQFISFLCYWGSVASGNNHPLYALPRGIGSKLSLLLVVPGALPVMMFLIVPPLIGKLFGKARQAFRSNGLRKRHENPRSYVSFPSTPSTNTRATLDALKERNGGGRR